jgi:hypothetical protein
MLVDYRHLYHISHSALGRDPGLKKDWQCLSYQINFNPIRISRPVPSTSV